jgi:hypothetical protein
MGVFFEKEVGQVSESWLGCLLLFSIFLYRCGCPSFCRSLPAPSLNPQLVSSHSDGATVRTESRDSKRTVSEVAMRETVSSDEHAAAGSPTPGMVVTMAVGPSEEVAGASAAQVAALVLSSLHQSVSPHVALGTSSQRLDDDVLREFDATRRLSELTTEWGVLVAGAASFGEKLQVSFS